jgi:hypothetical protein
MRRRDGRISLRTLDARCAFVRSAVPPVVAAAAGLTICMCGCRSDQDLVKAVAAETRGHNYDEVILATGRQGGTRLARSLRLDPVHQLRRRWGQRLTVFASGPATKP